jgi:hypothetical protein
MDDLEQIVKQGRTPPLVRWSLVAGFAGFGGNLAFSYALEQHTCSTGHSYLPYIIVIFSLAVAISGFAAGFKEHGRIAKNADEEGRRPTDRAYFQSLLGMIFSVAFVVAISALAIPHWVLGPCH